MTEHMQSRILEVEHETVYRYEAPVERSRHVFRLLPVHDHEQEVLEFRRDVSPDGTAYEFEDVFGNRAAYYEVTEPFTEMSITSRSRVRVFAPRPINRPLPKGPSIVPLSWTPEQHQLLQPYLLPPELPWEQLRELKDYAMSFAERRDYDLLEMLNDITQTMHRDFTYVPGATSVESTPYECFLHRRGVCQDFTNLLVCMARLLAVPARYRVGYIYTGGDYENKLQSEASHAWVECYIPWVGWRGFDPTNGSEIGADHVRVSVGRSHRDATPTSGTIFKGGGGEVLAVAVRVEEAAREAIGGT